MLSVVEASCCANQLGELRSKRVSLGGRKGISQDFSTPLRFSRNNNTHHEEHREHEGINDRLISLGSLLRSRLKVNAEGRGWRGNNMFSPAIVVLKCLAKEGVQQNIPILRPLLLSTEEIHSYLGAGFWFVFGCAKMNIKLALQKIQRGIS